MRRSLHPINGIYLPQYLTDTEILDDESLHRLLKVGKKIASNDLTKPFKLSIEYRGDSYNTE
jgi:hypothetical protein